MTAAAALLLGLLVVFLLVCACEWLPIELAALGLLVALSLSGLVAPEHVLEGFSNPAVVAIGGLFVLNAAVERTGVVVWLGGRLATLAERSAAAALSLLLAVTGLCSMFISNVATASLLMPAVISAAERAGVSASRFLMPLAFISLTGGMVTVIGATGNLIVQGMSAQRGGPEFGFFSFAAVGLPAFALSFVYLLTVGSRLVPSRRPAKDGRTALLRDYLVEVSVPAGSPLVGQTLADAKLPDRLGISILALRRGEQRLVAPSPGEALRGDDVLVVEATAEAVAAASASGELSTAYDVRVPPEQLESDQVQVYEALLPPRSRLEGSSARRLELRRRHGLALLAVLRRGRPMRRHPGDVRFQLGDELLLQGPQDAATALEDSGDVILLNRVARRPLRLRRAAVPLLVLATVVVVAALGVLPLAHAVLAGAFVVVLSKSIGVTDALEAVNLKIVLVVASVLPVGHALERSGAAHGLEDLLGSLHRHAGPWTVLAALFVGTALLTQVLQKAAVALAVPLAFAAARATGSTAEPFLMAVAMAGGSAFLTPLAHPVNLLVYAPGHYRFRDFLLIGLPLQLLTGAVALTIIPIVWPLGGA